MRLSRTRSRKFEMSGEGSVARGAGQGSVFGTTPVARLTIPMALGIAVARYGHSFLGGMITELWGAVALVAAALTVLAMIMSKRRQTGSVMFFGLTALFFALYGMASMTSSLRRTGYAWPEKEAAYSGVVMAPPQKYAKVTRLKVMVAEYYDGEIVPVDRLADVRVMNSPTTEALKAGDGVMFMARMARPQNNGNPYEFNYADYQILHGVGGAAFVYKNNLKALPAARTEEILERDLGFFDRLAIKAAGLRTALADVYSRAGIEGDALAVVSAMTFGDKGGVGKRTREIFSDTGVSHVLALSGLHLGIIFSLLQFVFSPGRRSRVLRVVAQVLILIFIWTYVFVVGMPQSLLRAAVMYSMVSLSMIFGRAPFAAGNLYLAAFVILLFSPASLFDIGFQLSFCSVFFIMRFSRLLAPAGIVKKSWAGRVWGMLSVSLCAQIGVAPLVAWYFHSFPVWFLLSNLVVVPLTGFVVACGFLLLALMWLSPAVAALGLALRAMLWIMLAFLGFMSRMPCAALSVYPSLPTVVIAYAALAFLILWAGTRRRMLYPAAALLLLAVVVECFSNFRERDVRGIYFYKGMSAEAVHFVLSSNENYIYSPPQVADSTLDKATAAVAEAFWERCGMDRPRRLRSGTDGNGIKFNNGLVLCGDKLLCILDSGIGRGDIPSPVRVDALYIAQGFRGDLAQWLKNVRPGMVVMDYRISDFHRAAYASQCAAANARVYDLSRNQCLKISL